MNDRKWKKIDQWLNNYDHHSSAVPHDFGTGKIK